MVTRSNHANSKITNSNDNTNNQRRRRSKRIHKSNCTFTHWLATIPYEDFLLPIPPPSDVRFLVGQTEIGQSSEYKHIQITISFRRSVRMSRVKTVLSTRSGHLEPSRSKAARDYCGKSETCVPGTRFMWGDPAINRNNARDWDEIWAKAKHGDIEAIPADIRVRCYRTLQQIKKDYLRPISINKNIFIFWGSTGCGKSHTAWELAGLDAYPKDPNTKYWDGYQGQENVVVDEFRGRIDISHMLRWCDKYPVNVENKFGGTTLCAKNIWITSNLPPDLWWGDIDSETLKAFKRRITKIVHYSEPFNKSL